MSFIWMTINVHYKIEMRVILHTKISKKYEIMNVTGQQMNRKMAILDSMVVSKHVSTSKLNFRMV